MNDAKAKSLDGLSLNDRILQGEDQLTSLNDVLLRSRQHKYLFVCDIKSMFLSVQVHERDRDSLRFLWFNQGDYNQQIKTYRWVKWCFGINAAPYAASRALRQTALDNAVQAPAEVVNILFQNIYVDDVIKSCQDLKKGSEMAKGVMDLCASGNFVVTKFQANDDRLLTGIPPERIVTTKKEVSLEPHSEREGA